MLTAQIVSEDSFGGPDDMALRPVNRALKTVGWRKDLAASRKPSLDAIFLLQGKSDYTEGGEGRMKVRETEIGRGDVHTVSFAVT